MAKPTFDTDRPHAGNLLELCPVNAGAIVSRPVIDTGATKMILFAMDAGQDISEHRAPFVATVHLLDGKLEFSVAGQTRTLGPHDWLVMPPDAPHDLRAPGADALLLTLVKG